MLRLFIVIVFYTLAIAVLPRFGPISDALDTLTRLPARAALIINMSAVFSASLLLYALMRKPGGLIYRRPSALLYIARMGLIGLIFGGLYELFQAMSGFASSVLSLALIAPAFMIGEAVYFITIWGFRKYRKVSGPMFPKPETARTPLADDPRQSRVPRLIVTVPIYIFVIVYLPQQQDFINLSAKLTNVSPAISVAISLGALVISTGLALKIFKGEQARAAPAQNDTAQEQKAKHLISVKANIATTLCIGLGIAALMNIVSYFVRFSPSLVLLILIPLAFTIAELLYQVINWRVKYGPFEA